ncbi:MULTISPECIES: hypothetical protein [unclassified Streptomyces]|uniref:hypothetical protein n=1 Tax=unclassified Streptomyces TaxID=2593676 RepID=UPI002E212E6E|nr:hypothetical protein OG760_37935 [Streptomyces sp. NBC_00963]
MFATIIAVVGTLLGAVVAGAFQQKNANRTQRAAADEQLRRERLEAVTALAAAGFDHRRAMWMRAEAQLAGAAPDRLEELRGASHITRSAITRPLVAVQVLIPDPAVRTTARDMVVGAFGMRDHAHSAEALAASPFVRARRPRPVRGRSSRLSHCRLTQPLS